MDNKKLILIITISVLIGLGIGIGGYYYFQNQKMKGITNFDQCQAAGYPVQESYPARCVLPDGRGFTQEIPDNGVACTMEVKICPDGTAVGRTAPDYEFAPCPK